MMDAGEVENLERVAGEHWFYRGKRRIVRHWIRRFGAPQGLLVDVGCGTGHFLAEWTGGPAQGFDPSPDAVRLARARGVAASPSPAHPLPLADGAAAIVTSMDVLEHVEDHNAAFQEMLRVLAPGGLLCVTVPALPALWSDWDVALGHHRRYTAASLRALVPPRIRILRLAYFNEWSVLPAGLARFGRKILGGAGDASRLEDWVPAPPLNRFLESLFVGSACLGAWRPPLGTSLLLVAVKE